MIIKDSIQIMGTTYKIEFKDEVRSESGQSCFALAFEDEEKIQIDKNNLDQHSESSLCHELVHLMLDSIGIHFNEEIKHNEQFVEQFSGLMHQILIQIIDWQK